MYKCTDPKCGMTTSDNQMEGNVAVVGPKDRPKYYCEKCGSPVEYIQDTPQNKGMQGAQATLNSTSDNRVINGNDSGNTTTDNSTTNINSGNTTTIHIGTDPDKLTQALVTAQQQTAETVLEFLKGAASFGKKEEKLLTEDWGEIDERNACKCNKCGKLVPSQHYDHQQHLCVNCLYEKADKLKDNDLWDEAIDEFKRVEMICTAEMLPEVQEAIGICYYMDDDNRKAKKYLALAETPVSYYVLGLCFEDDDIDQAIRNFTKAAEKDVKPAQEWLKDHYLRGNQINLEKAEPWLKKLAQNGDLNSQFQLANVYRIYARASEISDKSKVQVYYKEAAKWMEKVADAGIAMAKHLLGSMLLEGQGLTQDNTRGIDLLTQAAENGYLDSQYDLATIYDKGKYGITADPAKALSWYKKVAEQNSDEKSVTIALYQIGQFYLEGKGVGINYKEAAEWLKKAAKKGYVPAQFSLGKIYKDKLNNWEEAINWLSKASNAGNLEAKYELGCLYLTQSNTIPARKSEAEKLLSEAANSGHVGAMMKKAQCYEESKLYDEAKKYYQKAAGKGNQEAQQILDERFSGKTFAEKWRKFVNSPIWHTIGKMKGCLPFIIAALVILFAVNMCNKACQSCTGAHDSSSSVSGQTIYTSEEVDEPAHYPTGNQQLNKDIKSLFKNQYSYSSRNQFVSGEIQLHFIITKEGKAIVDSKSIPIENKEVVRALVEVMNHLPKQWQPAKKDSEYVNQYVDLTLNF